MAVAETLQIKIYIGNSAQLAVTVQQAYYSARTAQDDDDTCGDDVGDDNDKLLGVLGKLSSYYEL